MLTGQLRGRRPRRRVTDVGGLRTVITGMLHFSRESKSKGCTSGTFLGGVAGGSTLSTTVPPPAPHLPQTALQVRCSLTDGRAESALEKGSPLCGTSLQLAGRCPESGQSGWTRALQPRTVTQGQDGAGGVPRREDPQLPQSPKVSQGTCFVLTLTPCK